MEHLDSILNHITESTELTLEGHIDPLKYIISLKRISNVVNDSIKQIQDMAINEALKHGDNEFEFFGAKVHVRNGATRYNFKHIEEWVKLNKRIKDLESSAKDSLKLKLKGNQMVTEDGEIIEAADFTPGKETIYITL